MSITATATLDGQELTGIAVVNPGSWFGKTWLLEIGGCYSPLFLIVEADTVCDAIDELAESDTYGHNIVVEYPDLGDHDPDELYHAGSGQLCDLQDLKIHGFEWGKCPFPCRYCGEGLPEEGIPSADYWQLGGDD